MKKNIVFTIFPWICLFIIALNSLFLGDSKNLEVIKHTFSNQLFVRIPHSTKVKETHIGDKRQLLYSIYLDDQELMIRGYIQIWKLDDLKNYLINSKKISTFDFQSYSLNPIEIANFKGYVNEWMASFGDIYRISGKEYWLIKLPNDNVLRISFFTDSITFSKEQNDYIKKIIGSVKWNK